MEKGRLYSTDITPIGNPNNEDQDFIAFNMSDEAEGANAIFPKIFEPGVLEMLADVARVFAINESFGQKTKDESCIFRAKLEQFWNQSAIKLNLPGHIFPTYPQEELAWWSQREMPDKRLLARYRSSILSKCSRTACVT